MTKIFKILLFFNVYFFFPAGILHAEAIEGTQPNVPDNFIGFWDEIVSDGCANRHVLLSLQRKSLGIFEVSWDIISVRVLSENEIQIRATTFDDDMAQVTEQFHFTLVDDGNSLQVDDSQDFLSRCFPPSI